MTIDFLAYERQFLDHLAPVWHALPASVRGRFIVDPSLVDHARAKGIEVEPVPRLNVLRGRTVPHATQGRPALVASYGDTKEARRLGYGPLAYLEHGAGQSYGEHPSRANGSYSGGIDRGDTTLFLVPGPHPASKWRAAYPNARVEEVGCPLLDTLPRRVPGPSPVVAVSFHWPAPITVSGYAGTAAGDFLPALPALAERFDVIGHSHPKGDWPIRMERHYRKLGIPFAPDFEDVCRQADVYVCDNSSTIFEFAATGRPVVLMNAKHWHPRGPELGLRFWAASHVGVKVSQPSQLVAAVERALEHRPEDIAAREDALELVYTYRYGAAERAAAVIVDWLAEQGQVAA